MGFNFTIENYNLFQFICDNYSTDQFYISKGSPLTIFKIKRMSPDPSYAELHYLLTY